MSLPSTKENSGWSRKGRHMGGAHYISSDPRLKEATTTTSLRKQPCSAFLLAFFVITALFSALALSFDFSREVFSWGDESAPTASDLLGSSTESKALYSFATQKFLHNKAIATAKNSAQKAAARHEKRPKGGLSKDGVTTIQPTRSEGFQQLNEAPPRVAKLPQSWPYWPRPFGLNKVTVQTRAGREQQRLMGYARENDDGDHDAAHVDSLSVHHMPGVGRPPASPRRWYWPTEHSEAWMARWERIAFGTDNGAAPVVGNRSVEDGTVTPPLIPQLEKPWTRRHVAKHMSKPMIAGIRTLAEAFIAYDERVKASLAVEVRKDDALASIKARLAGIDYQPDIVPAYATLCGDNDCGVLPGHFSSFKTLGRFILVLNTADEGWVSLCRMLEEAFPDRFVVEYSIANALRLRAEQAEYKRRHNASDGVEELAMLYKERFDADIDTDSKNAIDEVKAHFKDQDAADDILDKTADMSTAYYRWHLRNLAPEQLAVPLGVHHSVAMGWNRILHICFRGDWPVDYVFIANGDFYLIRNSLARFAAHVFNVTRFGPERLRTLSAFQEGLPFSFFAHTYDAWRRFGEYDESIYPLYAEDNEFLLRIRSSGRELAAAYDEVYPKSNDFVHYRSMSQRGKRDGNTRLFINMIWDRRKEYLDAKYAAYSIKGAYVSPFMGALRSAYGAFPFNNTAISLRNSWAIDVKYRRCIFKPTDAERRACASMDADVIQRLLTSGKAG